MLGEPGPSLQVPGPAQGAQRGPPNIAGVGPLGPNTDGDGLVGVPRVEVLT